ncbi:MAG: hypothetical protein ACI4QT_06245 [Kiritimatiellia bacterium]
MESCSSKLSVNKTLLHKGGFANAKIYRIETPDGGVLIEKDFSSCALLIRNTIGRFLIRREVHFLVRLEESGVVPTKARRTGPFCMEEAFCEGQTLREIPKPNPKVPGSENRIPIEYFYTLFDDLQKIHKAGIVHLDLHNLRNILVSPAGGAILLDWQSALHTRLLLPPIRKLLEKVDNMGILKAFDKFHPEAMNDDLSQKLEQAKKIRRLFWLPRIHFERGRKKG